MKVTRSENIDPVYKPEFYALPAAPNSPYQKDTIEIAAPNYFQKLFNFLKTFLNWLCCKKAVEKPATPPPASPPSPPVTSTPTVPTPAKHSKYKSKKYKPTKPSYDFSKSSRPSSAKSSSKKRKKNKDYFDMWDKNISNAAPIGINNPGNDCCMNVILQGIIQIPSWQAALQELKVCQNFINDYNAARQDHRSVDKSHPQNLRRYLHSQNLKHGWNRNRQEDASDILNTLLQQSENPLTTPFLAFLNRSTVENNEFIEYLKAEIPAQWDRFLNAPPEILIDTAAPYEEDAFGERNKNDMPIEGNIMRFDLSVNGWDQVYECDYFVMHYGSLSAGGSSGHYTCARKNIFDGKWYEISDTQRRELSVDEAEALLRNATLIHHVAVSPAAD